jgi:hypothetical protein
VVHTEAAVGWIVVDVAVGERVISAVPAVRALMADDVIALILPETPLARGAFLGLVKAFEVLDVDVLIFCHGSMGYPPSLVLASLVLA